MQDWALGNNNDFEELHRPFGSSGKEFAYAILAGLKDRMPTTFRSDRRGEMNLIKEFLLSERRSEDRKKLGLFFDRETIDQIDMVTLGEARKFSGLTEIGEKIAPDEHALDRHPEIVRKFVRVSIIEEMRRSGEKYSDATVNNPEAIFLKTLCRAMLRGNKTDRAQILYAVQSTYGLGDESLARLSAVRSEEDLSRLYTEDNELNRHLAQMPEKVPLAEAADKYERILAALKPDSLTHANALRPVKTAEKPPNAVLHCRR